MGSSEPPRRGEPDRLDLGETDQTITAAARRRRCMECDARLNRDDSWVIQRTGEPTRLVCNECAERILDLPV